MSSDNGYNPLKWDCAKQGCFNRKRRPKLERFADCLPGRMAFSDIDAIVEIRGNLLLLEWKECPTLPLGQRILFRRLTRYCPATVFIIEGNAEHMEIYGMRIMQHGRLSAREKADMERVRYKIYAWAQWALNNPVSLQKEPLCHAS